MWLSVALAQKPSGVWSVVHLQARWISAVGHTKLGFIRVWLTFVLPAVEVYPDLEKRKRREKRNHVIRKETPQQRQRSLMFGGM